MSRINAAYAYYLSTYGNGKVSRYDSHKKSDLRKVYSSMVKTNKDSPLYKLSNIDDAARYAIDIKENAKDIQNVVASLSDNYGGFEDSFQKKVAVSNNEDVVTVDYVGDGKEENSLETFDIEVKRLPSPQENIGNYMENGAYSFTPGAYSFDLSTNVSSYEFQFNVNAGDTNINIMKKLADLVNNSTLGITATIRKGMESEGNAETSALILTSNQTGLGDDETSLFRISASEKPGSARVLELLGIDKITNEAKNSLFTVNGVEYSSLSSTFTVNGAFELTLKKVSEENTTTQIGFKTSTDAVADNIMSLLNVFNGILKVAENSSSNNTGEHNKLYTELSALSKVRRESLRTIGLMVDDKGYISLDCDILSDAITPENSDNTFAMLTRFKDAIGAKADNIAINPMNYVNKIIVSYKNPGKTFSPPYFTSIYSGMMLDRYI